VRYRSNRLQPTRPQSVILVGIFSFGDHAETLYSPHCHLCLSSVAERTASWLKMTLNAIAEELAEEQPGSNLVIAKLADLLFMQSLRAYLATDLHIPSMRGIMDPLVGRISACIAPERRWTLQALAEEAGCSRAVCAAIQRSGRPGALSYLTAWRMHVAAGLLLDGTGNIRTVASRVGYRSAAFSIAFSAGPGLTQRISPYDASC